MNILKTLFGAPQFISKTDTTADSPDPDPKDIWAFTDPDARAVYAQQGNLRALEHDIRYEVMRAEPWLPVEMEYKREIRRLLQLGAIKDKGSYWFTSPFPTVYRAVRNGFLSLGNQKIPFQAGDDIVFQCRMSRDRIPEWDFPVLVSKLRPTEKSMLCGQMDGSMKGMK